MPVTSIRAATNGVPLAPRSAVGRLDAVSVIAFYRDFLRTYPAAGRVSQPIAPAPDGEHIYSRFEILQLHAQHRKGAFAGREIEWARIENDIVAAGREGRVIGGISLEKSRSGDSRSPSSARLFSVPLLRRSGID